MANADLLRFLPAARFGEVRAITPLAAGLSGAAVYAVTTDAGELVLRIHGSDDSSWDVLIRSSRLAAEHGIAPLLLHVDETGRAAVSAKVAGTPFGAALAQPDVRTIAIRNVVTQLARLHAIPTDSLVSRDPIGLARSIWSEQTQRPGFPSWATPAGEAIAAAGRALERDARRAFSHNDVHPSNLLWDGTRAWLIDWERAGLAHPYSDLATFANFINLADEDALRLLVFQEQAAIDEEKRTTFLALRAYSRAVYGAVFLRLAPDLTRVVFASRAETLTLAECYGKMRDGTLDPRSGEGQALLGAAFLRQVAI